MKTSPKKADFRGVTAAAGEHEQTQIARHVGVHDGGRYATGNVFRANGGLTMPF